MQEENNTHGLEKPAEILLKNQKLERHENCNVEMRPSQPNAKCRHTQNLIQYMLIKIPISFSSPLFIYMHGNGKIANVKSAKLTIHLQRTCKRRIIPTVCRSLQKSFSNSYDEATDTNQETRTTRLEGNFNNSSEENIHSYADNWRLSNAPHWSHKY